MASSQDIRPSSEERIVQLLERLVEQNEQIIDRNDDIFAHIRERDRQMMSLTALRDEQYERREAKYEADHDERRQMQDQLDAVRLRYETLVLAQLESASLAKPEAQ